MARPHGRYRAKDDFWGGGDKVRKNQGHFANEGDMSLAVRRGIKTRLDHESFKPVTELSDRLFPRQGAITHLSHR